MRKVFCSPTTYVQEEGILGRLAGECASIGATSAYLIVDAFIDKTYHDMIASSFEAAGMPYHIEVFGGECSMAEVERNKALLGDANVIIGVGGGKTLDTSKSTAHFAGLPIIIAPTAASSDAPCSRLAVLYTPEHEFDRYLPLPKNPDMVLMDTEVIAKAPARFLAAGIGDAYATYVEAAACVKSDAVTMAGGHVTKAAITLAKLCHDVLVEDGVKAYAAAQKGLRTPAVENVIEANTLLSGIGFESSGLAASHAIHNGMTALEGTHPYLHGEKVAYGVLAQLVLEDAPVELLGEAYGLFRAVGLPTTLAGVGIADATDDDLLRVGELACDAADTMGNMPFEVTPADVAAALRVANELDAVIR